MLCSTIAPAKASPAINVQGKRRRTSGQEEARAFTTSNVDAFCANSADDKPPDTASSAHMAAAESWYDQADMAILTQEYSSPEVVRPAVSQSHRRTWPTEGAQRLAYGRDLAKISNAPRSGHRSSSRAPDGPPPKRSPRTGVRRLQLPTLILHLSPALREPQGRLQFKIPNASSLASTKL